MSDEPMTDEQAARIAKLQAEVRQGWNELAETVGGKIGEMTNPVIPAGAVEAAKQVLAAELGYQDDDWEPEVMAILEAAAPHMVTPDDVEVIEEKVKLVVQDIAMTVDYTERLYAAVQEIMAVTGLKPTNAR